MTAWTLPPLDLLEPSTPDEATPEHDHAEAIARALSDHGVGVVEVTGQAGPQAVSYAVLLAPGVLPSKVERVLGGIELAVGLPVRYAGLRNGRVVLEVGRERRASVGLSDVLRDFDLEASAHALPIPIGIDLRGRALVVALEALPHLIVAGTTGAGKSAYLHSVLTSLALSCTPDELRLHLIDTKQVELTAYADLPHTRGLAVDAHAAVDLLRSMTRTMDSRYATLKAAGVQNVKDYNSLGLETMRREVVVVEELADLLMSTQGKLISGYLERIAQVGRAAGIHLVVATQRPSAKVLPELLRANVPARVVFAVSTASDGQVALGQSGATSLMGAGDGLFAAPGVGDPVRFQSPFVHPGEVARIVLWWTRQVPAVEAPVPAPPVETLDPGATLRNSLDLEAAQRRQATVDLAAEVGVDPGQTDPHDLLREWGFPEVLLDALAEVLADRMAERVMSHIAGLS